jgi:hypothetical protein
MAQGYLPSAIPVDSSAICPGRTLCLSQHVMVSYDELKV